MNCPMLNEDHHSYESFRFVKKPDVKETPFKGYMEEEEVTKKKKPLGHNSFLAY